MKPFSNLPEALRTLTLDGPVSLLCSHPLRSDVAIVWVWDGRGCSACQRPVVQPPAPLSITCDGPGPGGCWENEVSV